MNQTTNSIALSLLLAILFLFIPFADDADLMSGIQSAKTFYFAFAMLALVLVGILLLVITKKVTVQLKSLDILLGVYFIYSCLHPFLFGYCTSSVSWTENISLAAFYLLVRRVGSKQIDLLLYVVMLAGIAQAIYGSMQLYGFSYSNHSLFNITGSFFNPGPYAGYLAGIFPIALFYYWAHDELIITKKSLLTISGLRDVSLKYMSLVALISILLVLPASRSRASWLGALAGSLLVAWAFRKNLVRTLKLGLSATQKRGVLIIAMLLFIVALGALYQFKKGSADGRVLIWKVAGKMVSDKPFWGHGTDQFAAQYMKYQANYFKPNPQAPEAMRADNVVYAYNELLKLLVEKGLVGLLLALAILWVLFFVKPTGSSKTSSLVAAKGGLLVILAFAMFAFPSGILSIKILFVLLMVIVAICQSPLQSSCFKLYHNTILNTTLGNSYKALAQNSQAEEAYLQAWHMAPSRFYPLYLLATLYNDTDQTEKAVSMAKRVLNKEVKIDSQAIEEIKEEMRNIIEQAASLSYSNHSEGKRQEAPCFCQLASCLAPSLNQSTFAKALVDKGKEVIGL